MSNATIHAYVPGYSYWTLQEIKLSNGSYEGFHNVNFTGLVLTIENATPAVLEYYLTYEFNGKGFQTSTAEFPFTITGRRNVTWWYNSDWDQPDAVMQAGWITPTQPEVLAFAKTRLGLNNTSDYRSAYLIAMEVYNSLFRTAILYEANQLDKRLPIDVIRDGKGDCDEMSALYASILEAVGIETKQVNIPGHQYMLIKLGEYWKAFDPTITEYYGNRIFADFTYSMERGEEEYLNIDGNTTIYYPREEWNKGLGRVVVPGTG